MRFFVPIEKQIIPKHCVLSKGSILMPAQKADSFVVSCFVKYETRPVPKLSKPLKPIGSFVRGKIFAKLIENICETFLALKRTFLALKRTFLAFKCTF
jgi:hypothetical protein